MTVSLKPSHLKRYKDIAVLLVKYGRGDLAKRLDVEGELPPGSTTEVSEKPKADELTRDLERLGPTFVKVGQLLSTRADLLPVAYLEALARLQDQVEPFSFAEVERIVTEDLGVRISKAFAEFEATPLAAASLGQIHRATLRRDPADRRAAQDREPDRARVDPRRFDRRGSAPHAGTHELPHFGISGAGDPLLPGGGARRTRARLQHSRERPHAAGQEEAETIAGKSLR